jgi:hypothetical protein
MTRVFVVALLAALIVRVPDAPATVAEQRARLPPAAECDSEVAGKWKALIFSDNTGHRWYEWILEIKYDPNDKTILTGMIYVDTWSGEPDSPEPGPCTHRYKGKMVGSGSFVDGQVSFGGGPFELTEEVCGSFYGYNPDNFTGKLEPERQEFQSVNNDGGGAVNEPTVFRRIACPEENDGTAVKPTGDLKPPAFYPKKKSSSGGC